MGKYAHALLLGGAVVTAVVGLGQVERAVANDPDKAKVSEVEVVNPESKPVPVTVVGGNGGYQVVGISTEEVAADAGFGAMHGACQNDFGAQSRICTTVEAALSPSLSGLVFEGAAWLQPVIAAVTLINTGTSSVFTDAEMYDETGVKTGRGTTSSFASVTLNCEAWTSADGSKDGTVLIGSTLQIATRNCGDFDGGEVTRPVVCCAPVGNGG